MSPTPPAHGPHPEALLASFVDGSIDPAARAEVTEHLATCTHCRQEVALTRQARAALRDLPPVQAPPGLPDAVLARLDAPTEVREHRQGGRHRAGKGSRGEGTGGRRTLVPLAVAAVVVVAALAIVLPRLGGPSEDDGDLIAAGSPSPVALGDLRLEFLPGVNHDTDSIRLEAMALAGRPPGPREAQTEADEAAPGTATDDSALAETPSAIRTAGPARSQAALDCLLTAFEGFPGTPTRLIRARFDGAPAYLAAVVEPDGTITVWVADAGDCRPLAFSSVAP